MIFPRLKDLSEQQESSIYDRLRSYNTGRQSFKVAGAYLIVTPYETSPTYSLWIYSPDIKGRSFFFITQLSPSFTDSLRTVSGLFYYSKRPIYVMDYHPKQLHRSGEDLISFGKYRGYYLSEILQIDPNYVGWIAHKYEARTEAQLRFVRIAALYDSVSMDRFKVHVKALDKQSASPPKKGSRLTNVFLKVTNIRLEDDPYRTRYVNGRNFFYVNQNVLLSDANGHKLLWLRRTKSPSLQSGMLPASERAFHIGEVLHILSASVSDVFKKNEIEYMKINRVKLSDLKPS